MIIKNIQLDAFRVFNKKRFAQNLITMLWKDEPDLMSVNRTQSVDDFVEAAVLLGITIGLSKRKHFVIMVSILLSHLSYLKEWVEVDWISSILGSAESGTNKMKTLIKEDASIRCNWS